MSNDFEKKYKDWHQKISFLKSGVRIAACLSCVITLIALGHLEGGTAALMLLAIGLGLAELLGIVEEWI